MKHFQKGTMSMHAEWSKILRLENVGKQKKANQF